MRRRAFVEPDTRPRAARGENEESRGGWRCNSRGAVVQPRYQHVPHKRGAFTWGGRVLRDRAGAAQNKDGCGRDVFGGTYVFLRKRGRSAEAEMGSESSASSRSCLFFVMAPLCVRVWRAIVERVVLVGFSVSETL